MLACFVKVQADKCLYEKYLAYFEKYFYLEVF